jgi:hypothetical protein
MQHESAIPGTLFIIFAAKNLSEETIIHIKEFVTFHSARLFIFFITFTYFGIDVRFQNTFLVFVTSLHNSIYRNKTRKFPELTK